MLFLFGNVKECCIFTYKLILTNNNKMKATTIITHVVKVSYNFIADYFRKGYFFKLAKDICLALILLFIFVAILALAFHLPDLGKALN